MRIRPPAQAGRFYSDKKNSLEAQIKDSFVHKLGPGSTRKPEDPPAGIVVPHAGLMYSGPVAAHAYSRLDTGSAPRSIVIIGPNHTGLGTGVSAMNSGAWQTPLGIAEIDGEKADRIVKQSGLVDVEDEAHRYEHSIEMQLLFLQYLYPGKFRFVPICMMLQDLETSRNIGRAVAESVKGETDFLIVASSDWTHYEPQNQAVAKDHYALDLALKMDEEKFQEGIEEKSVSACGYGPVTALMCAMKHLGAESGELLSYATSGDTTGDTSSVVGYAALAYDMGTRQERRA